MKKWLIGTGLMIIVATASVYLFIPDTLVVSQAMAVKCNPYAAFRTMSKDQGWEKCWPSPNEGGNVYSVSGRLRQQMQISIGNGGRKDSGHLFILPKADVDSSVLQWQCTLLAGYNPFKRIARYREALVIRHETGVMLSNLRSYLEMKIHVYGMDLYLTKSRDSTLVMMQWKTIVYPETKELYAVIMKLRKYASSQGAKETDPPMLHVLTGSGGSFEVMVAVPVDKQLKGEGNIVPRKFVPWKIISGEVRGGAYTAEQAMVQLQQYMEDHQYPAMAMPFQALVTERNNEPDTSRWVTRVIVPVP
jgi:hypothetical protein